MQVHLGQSGPVQDCETRPSVWRAPGVAAASVLAVGISTGCGSDGREEEDVGTDSGIALSTSSGEGGAAEGGMTTIKLDTPPDDGSGGAGEGGSQGCQKVDFLFVIDSSGSMADEQDNLLASAPGFIAAIEDTLMFDDFHVMVVDAGNVPGSGCDGVLGAGRIASADGQDCGLVDGKRYATQAQPNLAETFSCMAARGYDGSADEKTMDAMQQSIGSLVEPGECNEGFLRDDAILVVTIISDEEDDSADATANPPLDGSCAPADSDPNSQNDPPQWRDAVIGAKSGDAAAMVVLALVGDCDIGGSCPGIELDLFNLNTPITGAEPAPRLREFADSFQFGSVGPVCAPDYAPFFQDAVSEIASACEGFIPPG
jgi:hypothetical protein